MLISLTVLISIGDIMLAGSSKVTSRGQITIPQELREKYGIKSGDTVYFLEDNGTLTLKIGPIKLA
jgi:AbrB family looped-hinge helix DNA binding protein